MTNLAYIGRLLKGLKLGIGGRLILSFAVVAALTAGAGSASSWLAIRGATIMDRIGSRTLPTVTASLTFAQRSSVLAAAAPALALQKDQASLESEGAKLKALIAEQKSRIAELRNLMESSSMLDPIEKSSDQLAGKIGEIESLAKNRIGLIESINKKVSETLAAHQDFNDVVHPLVEVTQSTVDSSLADVTGEDGAKTKSIATRLKNNEMPELKALMEMESAGNIVNGMLAAAANAPNKDSLTDLRTQYEWGELSLNQDIETLGASFGDGKLASTGKALLADGSGRESIFALREKRAAADADIAVSLESLVKITSTLAHQVEQLVEHEKSAAAESVLESGTVARQSLIVNAVLSGIVVLASALIGWLYVGRVVVRRLNSLARGMGRLATGDTSVEIDSWGSDEITTMARAVQVFKSNIIRGDALAREAEAHASDRESIRTRTDAERTSAAAKQAAVVAGLASGLSHLAKGDLTYELQDAFPEAYEALRQDFNVTVSQLRDVMQQIVVNSSVLQTGAGEISAAADNLSRRTEQQAASLEETAAALDQITATVRQTAQGAIHVQEIVGTAKVDVELSGQVVREAVDAMGGIERSSAKISQIIGVIDEIAFQTNLLALNAGVEAARAGDSGRGFAVVASEVRALAQRSAGAAKEIKALILASEQQVGRGVSLVGQTGQVLERVVGQVAKINAIVGEIAASAKEQATGLHQVNTAVNEMDQVTQQNAAMVEESTAASRTLARETEDLNRLISRFEVNKHGTAGNSERVRRASSPDVRTRTVKTATENGMPLRLTIPNGDYRASA